jgi:outer membrane protein
MTLFFRRSIWLTSLFAILFTGSAYAQQTQAPTATPEIPLRIIILSLDDIRRQSIAIKDIRQQITEFRKGFQVGIQKEEDSLRVANKELAKKRTILSPEAFAKERRQFEQRVVGVQKLVQKRKRQLDQAQIEAMLKVEAKLNQIIADIAQRRKATMVLRRKLTVLVASGFDVTAEILVRLNKELVKVPVNKPSD